MRTKVILALSALVCSLSVAPALADVIYTNGPTDGTIGAYNITGLAVSDSFAPLSSGALNSATFGVWTFGEPLTSIDWKIGTSAFASDVAFGTATTFTSSQLTPQGDYGVYGYWAVYNDTFSLPSVSVDLGNTYWFTLTNALTANPNTDPAYWDRNNGPSSAVGDQTGPIPSEAFTLSGDPLVIAPTPNDVPEPFTLSLFGAGLAGMAAMRRGRKQPKA